MRHSESAPAWVPAKSPVPAPVSVTMADGSTVKLDQETLAQAVLLQKMKCSFGSDASIKAMMMLMKQAGGGNQVSSLLTLYCSVT